MVKGRPPGITLRRRAASALAAIVVVSSAAISLPRAEAAPVGTLLVMGDSLTVGASILGKFSGSQPAVRRSWKKVVVDAKEGRTTRQGATLLPGAIRRSRATAVMIALGTNDMMSRRTAAEASALIDQVMVATGDRPVLWVNLEFGSLPARERPARARMFNSQLVRATKKWDNLRIANWNRSFTPSGRSRFLADGVHLTTSGYKTRAAHYTREVAAFRTWIDAVLSTTTTSTTTTTTTTTSTLPGSTTTIDPASSTTLVSTTTLDTASSSTSSTP